MSEANQPERQLGVWVATCIGLGTMIGGGIFILPSVAAARAGPASTISFALAGGISLLAALSHAELATDMPVDGGGYEYVHRALGAMVGTVVGWGMWIGLVFASAFYAVGFAQYLTFFTDAVPIAATAVVLTALLTALNYYGAAEAGWLQNLIVVSLLGIILAFVGMGVPHVDTETLSPFNPEGWGAVVATTGTVYVALIGFSLIATCAGEIERPERNVPLAMIAAVVIPTALYVFVMYVSTGVLPVEELATSHVPVADVAAAYAGGLGALAMTIGAVLATVSSANASILSAGRVTFAMGQERVLTDWFREIHESFGTPSRAILVTGIGIVAIIFPGIGIALLAEVASFMFLLTYGLVHVSVVWLRRYDQEYDPKFRIPDPLYPAVPVLGVLAIAGVMVQMRSTVVWGGIALVVVGIGWYFAYVEAHVEETVAD